MFQGTYDAVAAEASGEIALGYTAAISGYHRIQASPGYRAAAHWTAETLRAAGVPDVQIESYPARFDHAAWSSDHWPEWECRAARLRVVGPETATRALGTLADYAAVKLSLVQRSAATPPGGVTAPLVWVERGEEDSDYDGLDVAGKIVFTGGDARRVHELAVERYGALGLVTDRMARIPDLRDPMDLPDARQYTSFWPNGTEKRQGWGFVLTPRQGATLRALLQRGEAITVHAEVDATFTDGTMENVVATIPGETDEEVLVIGHLCHPQPSANDNATGAAAAMEIARTLSALVADGRLPKPRRTIRCLLVPEITGSFAYLAMHEDRIPKTVAAINLDMVGEDPAQTGSSYLLVRSPIQTEGYSGVLAARILEQIAAHDRPSFSGTGGFAGFAYSVQPFSAGSDHYVYGDPTVGIPCPMILNWPDKNYHTSADTIEKVSPVTLRRSVILAGTYAAFLAGAGAAEAVWLAHELAAEFRADAARRTGDALQTALTGERDADALDRAWGGLTEQLRFRQERQEANVRACLRLDAEAENALDWLARDAEQTVRDELRRAVDAFRAVAKAAGGGTVVAPGPRPRTAAEEEAAALIPTRQYRGPVGMHYLARNLSAQQREELRTLMANSKHGRTIGLLAIYWADGERNLLETADLVEREEGVRDVPFLVAYMKLLAASGFVSLAPSSAAEAQAAG